MFTKKSRKCRAHLLWLCDHHVAGQGGIANDQHSLVINIILSTYTVLLCHNLL